MPTICRLMKKREVALPLHRAVIAAAREARDQAEEQFAALTADEEPSGSAAFGSTEDWTEEEPSGSAAVGSTAVYEWDDDTIGAEEDNAIGADSEDWTEEMMEAYDKSLVAPCPPVPPPPPPVPRPPSPPTRVVDTVPPPAPPARVLAPTVPPPPAPPPAPGSGVGPADDAQGSGGGESAKIPVGPETDPNMDWFTVTRYLLAADDAAFMSADEAHVKWFKMYEARKGTDEVKWVPSVRNADKTVPSIYVLVPY